MNKLLTTIICYFSNRPSWEAEAILWKESKQHGNARNCERSTMAFLCCWGITTVFHFARGVSLHQKRHKITHLSKASLHVLPQIWAVSGCRPGLFCLWLFCRLLHGGNFCRQSSGEEVCDTQSRQRKTALQRAVPLTAGCWSPSSHFQNP